MDITQQWIALSALPGLGVAKKLALIEHGWSFERLVGAKADQLKRLKLPLKAVDALLKLSQGKGCLKQAIDQVLEWNQHSSAHHIISFSSSDYPFLLKQISDPPLVLLVIGDPSVLSLPQLAMVGSRNSTRQGVKTATLFAQDLSASGVVVTSGLAAGIDGAAHQAVVSVKGRTIAVMATGPDTVYPRHHGFLAEQIILNGGALVTEYFPGVRALPYNFPRRNRIIAGLSQGTLVVEAAQRSGSLITARLALEYNRELFAIPGALQSPQSAGCHRLIRDGAVLVQDAWQIIEALSFTWGIKNTPVEREKSDAPEHRLMDINAQQANILMLMENEVITVDALVSLSGLQVNELMIDLMSLELKGLIIAVANGYQRVTIG